MKLGTKILKWIVMGLLIAMIFPAVSCRDEMQEENVDFSLYKSWNCGSGGIADIFFMNYIEGDVISAEEGYYIVLSDSMPYVESVSHTRVFKIRDKGLGEFPCDETWPITDFSKYVGNHITFHGIVKRFPEKDEQIIHVDGKEITVTSHLSQISSILDCKTRSNNIWNSEV